jgi:PTS system, glucose subfamily, IIA component
LTTVNAINESNPSSFIGVLIGCAVSIVGAFVLVQVIGFNDPAPEIGEAAAPSAEQRENKALSEPVKELIIASPLTGEVKPLAEVNDPTFSAGILGQGVAIVPSEGKLYAPVNGVISSIFETKHAVGITTDDGVELMMHIGLETVSLGGKYFSAKIKDGDRVSVGDLMIEFDLNAIKKDFDTITPVLVINGNNYAAITLVKTSGAVMAGEKLIEVHKA